MDGIIGTPIDAHSISGINMSGIVYVDIKGDLSSTAEKPLSFTLSDGSQAMLSLYRAGIFVVYSSFSYNDNRSLAIAEKGSSCRFKYDVRASGYMSGGYFLVDVIWSDDVIRTHCTRSSVSATPESTGINCHGWLLQ